MEPYLDLMARALTGSLDTSACDNFMTRVTGPELQRPSASTRTMIGRRRLETINDCVRSITTNNVNGICLEAGCWFGGAVLFMAACFRHYDGSNNRIAVGCDLFRHEGSAGPVRQVAGNILAKSLYHLLPKPIVMRMVRSVLLRFFPSVTDEESVEVFYNKLAVFDVWSVEYIPANMYDDVMAAAKRYGLEDNVCYLKGYFSDTLPSLPYDTIALLRLDSDFYESTTDVLEHAYPRIPSGGFCIVDDYNGYAECRRAVHDYMDRTNREWTEDETCSGGNKVVIKRVDEECVYWQV